MSRKVDAIVKCPFLRMAQPNTASLHSFVQGCSAHGFSSLLARVVGLQVTWNQKGFWAAMTGQAPDVERLDQVPGISHSDMYQAYPEVVQTRLQQAADADGKVEFQTLVDIKKWIAAQENVEIIEASKTETTLVFLGALGDVETQKVPVDNVLQFLKGEKLAQLPDITFSRVKKVGASADWK